MARIRSIKPGFFRSEDLAELPYEARLCYAGLWLIADREGRLEDRPRRIKADLFPYDTLDIDAILTLLTIRKFIVRYEINEVPYIAIPTFLHHQRPKSDETASVIPAPSTLLSIPRGKLTTPRPYNGILGLGSGIRDPGTGVHVDVDAEAADGDDNAGPDTGDQPGKAAAPIRWADAERFAAMWNEITQAPIAKCRELSTNRKKHIKARLTERSWDEWAEVFRLINESHFCRGNVQARPGANPWIASFDWIIGSPDTAIKVLEGKYENRHKARL